MKSTPTRCKHGRVLTPGLCWECESEKQCTSTTTIESEWKIGDAIRFPPYRMVWIVEAILNRGLVISHVENRGHKHIVEWGRVSEGVRIGDCANGEVGMIKEPAA